MKKERKEKLITFSFFPRSQGGANCPKSAKVYKIFSYAEGSTNENLIKSPAPFLFLEMETNYPDLVFLSKFFHCSSH